MLATTSTQFASAIASGTDWRDTSKAVLEALEAAKTSDQDFNFGFLYVSDYLSEDLTSILNLFKSVLGIENWVGSVGLGVCGNGREYIDEPAISAMIGRLDAQDFCVFADHEDEAGTAGHALESWMHDKTPLMVFTHGNPLAHSNPADLVTILDDLTNAYIVGGLTSSRTRHYHIADEVCETGLSGAAFADTIPVSSVLCQGCKKIGETYTITKCDEGHIFTLDDKPALDVFENDLRVMTIKKTDIDPKQIWIDKEHAHNKEALPENIQNMFKGEVLCAIPVSETDQDMYLVRNITGVDEDERALEIAHPVMKGDRIFFVYRDDRTVCNDLSRSLVQMRERITRETGEFSPRAGVYISCVARAFTNFSNTETGANLNPHGQDGLGGEMSLIRDVIGDIPMTGFYAAGEINSAKIYGYSGILILFV